MQELNVRNKVLIKDSIYKLALLKVLLLICENSSLIFAILLFQKDCILIHENVLRNHVSKKRFDTKEIMNHTNSFTIKAIIH